MTMNLFVGVFAVLCMLPLAASTGLIHRYSFNEYTGSAVNSVNTSRPALLVNGAVFSSGTVVVANGSYVQLPTGLLKTGVNTVLTVELWVTVAPNNGLYMKIFQFGDATLNCPSVHCYQETYATLACAMCIDGPNGTWMRSSVTISQGEMHVVAVFNFENKRMKLHVNGVMKLAQSITSTTTLLPGKRPADVFYLGKSAIVSDPPMTGNFNELRLWSRELSEFEVSLHYSKGPNDVPGECYCLLYS
jgi:hypothetical protein